MLVYRYSTLSLFQSLGISLGTDAVPRYQDLSFKFNFPTKKGGNLSFFGIGGKSLIDILISNQTAPKADFYGEDDRDQYFRTQMGMTGISYTKTINEKTFMRVGIAQAQFMRVGIAQAHEQNRAEHFYILRHVDAASNLLHLPDPELPLQGEPHNRHGEL